MARVPSIFFRYAASKAGLPARPAASSAVSGTAAAARPAAEEFGSLPARYARRMPTAEEIDAVMLGGAESVLRHV